MPCYASLALLLGSAIFAQNNVIIDGDIPRPTTLTGKDLAAMPLTSISGSEHGTSATYEGVLLYDALKKAGGPLDAQLKGKALAAYVLAQARDGYQMVYTLTELDPAFTPITRSSSPIPSTASPCPKLRDLSAWSCRSRRSPLARSGCWSG
jgi:hypothetical protein